MNLLQAVPMTDWGKVWTVTLLGFGIVLALLVFLIFVLTLFGWIMQKMNAPKVEKKAEQPAPKKAVVTSAPSDQDTMAAIAMALAAASDDDKVAIAYALHLYYNAHDIPTAMIVSQVRNTSWNDKSIGMNNRGF